MDESAKRLVAEMIRTERNRRTVPADRGLVAVRDRFTSAGALGHGRYPVQLDEASGEEYEARAEAWLSIVRRVARELAVPWTEERAMAAIHAINVELAKDWDEIYARLERFAKGRRMAIASLDAAKSRAERYVEQEITLLTLKEDRTRIPLAERLAADRYRAVLEAWRKAHGYLDGPSQDLANAAKEAVGAVETLARLVIGDQKATLGDAIKLLRSKGRVQAPLLKGIEELWGWASDEPGVRHAGREGAMDIADVRYCIGLAQAAMGLLLAVDHA